MDTDDTASGSGAQKRRTVPDDDRTIERKIPRTTERDSAEQRVFDRLFGPPPEEMQQEAMEAAPCRTALSAEEADSVNKMDTDDTASGSGAQKRRTVPDDDRTIERKIPRTTERDSAEQRVFDRLFGPPPEEMQQEAMEAAPCRTALSAVATSYYWQEASYGEVPARAVRAGTDKDGGPLYVGRAPHAGDLLPAKVAPTHQGAFVSWNCLEHSKFHYEVLVLGAGVAEWVPSSNGEVPDGAVPVGHTTDGETLYVARVQHDGTTTPGKVHQSHSVCYIPYGGREIAYSHYEVLVI